ncbi:DUF350 domain-containing protein [bacterium (Candidatus Gribaldobacteria) CG08_land_8_20_14_0_20_39_15]|uniref:DUF350 domain-containing protein n=1 Tax=bacterium (Candidatus Gribaldobacteria) CG08_land_8_20_14_0_20_39_15 TaxID=2014273 RepID=A0A2M6XUK4_9BACT|nr:MAG: DUF350 domain-containing protein [bacterium (Candidatus Gribaldobacteria) CG08_land_8_20_14_0_20_39_15]
MLYIFQQYLITFGWAVVGAIAMAIGLAVLLKIFFWLTPIDEWEEIKKGNIAMAIILVAVVLGAALVIGLIVMA